MSAGAFVRSRYEADYGAGTAVHPIRCQPETLLAEIGTEDNSAPAAALTNPISAVTSKGRRGSGLRPRTITLQFPLTGQPTGYKAGGYTVIPALNKAFYAAATAGITCTYLGVSCAVVSKSAEEAS